MAKDSKVPGLVSDTFGHRPSLNRNHLVSPTVSTGVKGITVRNTYAKTKSALTRSPGHPPGGKKSTGKEPYK